MSHPRNSYVVLIWHEDGHLRAPQDVRGTWQTYDGAVKFADRVMAIYPQLTAEPVYMGRKLLRDIDGDLQYGY